MTARTDLLDLDELAARWDLTRDSAANKARRWELPRYRSKTDKRITFYLLADVHRMESVVESMG